MKKEITYLINHYYRLQEHRIAFAGQIRALKEAKLPTEPLDYYFEKFSEMEKEIIRHLKKAIAQEPLWKDYLKGVKGIGPVIASGLINLIDFKKARHVSSLWKYAGRDVVDGEARSRKKKHLVPKTYKNKQGKKIKTQGISFNPLLKTLTWKAGVSFLKSGSPYRKIYDERKKYERRKHPELTRGHIHNRAMTYMIKRFLLHLWIEGRKIEGLPVSEPYVIAKLGHRKIEDGINRESAN